MAQIVLPLHLPKDMKYLPKELKATLEAPEEDEICPISHEKIGTLELDFLPPNSVFLPKSPELSCMRLSCGHKFNALHITYHFARNQTVQCPICRAGPQARIQAKAIPCHLRRRIVRRAKSEQKEDRQSLVQSDAQVALQASQDLTLIAAQPHDAGSTVALTYMRQYVSHFVAQGTTCLEIRYSGFPERSIVNPLHSHYHTGPFTVFMCRMGYDGALPPADAERFVVLGGFTLMGIPTRFPSSEWVFTYPGDTNIITRNISRQGSVIKYYITRDDGGVACLTWSIPTHFFYLMAQEPDA